MTLYGRAALVQKELNVTQDEMLNFTDKIALALRVAGTDAQSASGALLQLSQALGSGVVRAEEFNSILEGALPIAQAAAAGLKEAGGSVARLRQLVVDGKVSSEAFFRAFEAGSVILEHKVAGATMTTSQGLQLIRNEMVKAAGDFAKGSMAADSLGKAFGMMADKINSIDFEEFGKEVRTLVEMLGQLQSAMAWVQNMGANFGAATGLDRIGEALTGGEVQRQIGPVTITSTRALQDRIDRAFGNAVETASGLTEEAIRRSAGQVVNERGKTGRLPASTVAPVSLSDYDAPNSKKKKGSKREDDYARETRQIRERTAALMAETAAMAGLNPLVDDYGYAVEKARATQELLTAAKKAGIEVTPALEKEINNLAETYAFATVEAEKLAESHDKIREAAEEAMTLAKDVTRGLIDGFIEGKSAADIMADALRKIGNALINDVLNNLLKIQNMGGGGGGFLSGLLGLFGGGFKANTTAGAFFTNGFADGGYTGPGPKNRVVGPVHAGEVVWSQDDIRRAGGVAAVEAMRKGAMSTPAAIQMPTMPSLASRGAGGVSIPININIDARNADREGLMRVEQQVEKLRAEIPARVVEGVRKAQKSNVKLV